VIFEQFRSHEREWGLRPCNVQRKLTPRLRRPTQPFCCPVTLSSTSFQYPLSQLAGQNGRNYVKQRRHQNFARSKYTSKSEQSCSSFRVRRRKLEDRTPFRLGNDVRARLPASPYRIAPTGVQPKKFQVIRLPTLRAREQGMAFRYLLCEPLPEADVFAASGQQGSPSTSNSTALDSSSDDCT
jgi:hypothetical protein